MKVFGATAKFTLQRRTLSIHFLGGKNLRARHSELRVEMILKDYLKS